MGNNDDLGDVFTDLRRMKETGRRPRGRGQTLGQNTAGEEGVVAWQPPGSACSPTSGPHKGLHQKVPAGPGQHSLLHRPGLGQRTMGKGFPLCRAVGKWSTWANWGGGGVKSHSQSSMPKADSWCTTCDRPRGGQQRTLHS